MFIFNFDDRAFVLVKHHIHVNVCIRVHNCCVIIVKIKITRTHHKLVLVITAVGKGQQQTQKNQYQQQFNQLFTVSSKPQTHAQLQQQPIQEQKSIAPNDDEPTYRPIMFPSSEDDEKISDKFHAAPFAHNNLIPQTVEQKVEIPSPTVELLRPTRHNVATMSSRPSRPHTDMEVEYVRDFAWKLFQVTQYSYKFFVIFSLTLC